MPTPTVSSPQDSRLMVPAGTHERVLRVRALLRRSPPTARAIVIMLVVVACLFLAVWGFHDQQVAVQGFDFAPVYAGAGCMVAGCNPYSEDATRTYFLQHDGAGFSLESFRPFNANYPPTALFYAIPLSFLSWPVAENLWAAIIIAVFVAGICAVADLMLHAGKDERGGPLVLAALVLAVFVCTSLLPVMLGQPATLVIGLLCLAVWCFVRARYTTLGVAAFALSLVFKPHLGAFILLYFFLSSVHYRRLAIKVTVLAVVLSLPGIVWASMMPASHHWVSDLSTNLVGIAARGSASDPGPRNVEASQLASLQAMVSVLRDDRPWYNHVTWIVCGVLLGLWLVPVFRLKRGMAKDLLCLSAIACLTMLPIYHRVYDTRLLLLTFPALTWVLLHSRGTGRLALTVTSLATILTYSQLHHVKVWKLFLAQFRPHVGPLAYTLIFDRIVPLGCLLSTLFFIACCYWLLVQQSRPQMSQSA